MNKTSKTENIGNKIVGEIKETAGRITGNQQMELKGRIQSAKADFKEKTSIRNNAEKVKEKLAKKANDFLDKR